MSSNCGCKGARYCRSCVDSERVRQLKHLPDNPLSGSELDKFSQWQKFLLDPLSGKVSCVTEADLNELDCAAVFALVEQRRPTALDDCSGLVGGVTLVCNLLSDDEEARLLGAIDETEWHESQSGRRKQDYGPKVNFKRQRIKVNSYKGLPDYADAVLARMAQAGVADYLPFELCNLEYQAERGAAIELHRDDTWVWGERLVSVTLGAPSVMLLTHAPTERLLLAPMPRRSLLSLAADARYDWQHGIPSQFVSGRRVALTMRESAPAFRPGGQLYEQFGRQLTENARRRLPTAFARHSV